MDKQIASKEDRHQAWSQVLDRVAKHEALSWVERAAAIVLVVAEQDGLDGGETIVDLRRVLDRGLAGLKEKGVIDQVAGEYRLLRGEPSRKPGKVDAETPAETKAPGEEAEPTAPKVEV